MAENVTSEENILIEKAIAMIQGMIPSTWGITRTSRQVNMTSSAKTPVQFDDLINFKSPYSQGGNLLVEAKQTFTPRQIQQLLSGLTEKYRSVVSGSGYSMFIVAPWLSKKSRQILEENGINFADLSGNVRIVLDNPAVILSSMGADKNPNPDPMLSGASLKGPKAGRLVRFLTDVAPPYSLSEIAVETRLAPSYVYRLLKLLSDETLVERGIRGQVEMVDAPGIIRAWSDTYEVFRMNRPSSYIAPNGPVSALQAIGNLYEKNSVVVTGSFAAVRLAPIAAPSLLIAYCKDVDAVAKQLNLLPSDRGSNVTLLRPFDEVAFDRVDIEAGVAYAALAQVAVDCLSGNGRMPQEGEALLDWMEKSQSSWRIPSLSALRSKRISE